MIRPAGRPAGSVCVGVRGYGRRSGATRGREDAAHINERIGDDAQAHPPLEAGIAFVASATQPVPAFHDADAALAARAPFLPGLEPATPLEPAALRIFGGSVGHADPRHAARV